MNVEERLEEIQAIFMKLQSTGIYAREFPLVVATLMVAEQLESIGNILKNNRGV